MQYGSIIQLPSIAIDEIVEVTRKKRIREPFPGFTVVGNGKETRHGGKSMDLLDICKQLNTAEMNLLQTMRDAIDKAKMNGEKNVNIVVPSHIDDWSKYLSTALKKNYPHMNCLGIIRRVKRGTYMINPLLFIPTKEMQFHRDEWDKLEVGCNEQD